MNFVPTDVAAWLIIVGCFTLIFLGIDGEVKSILCIAAGWAFRKPAINGMIAVKNKIVRRK